MPKQISRILLTAFFSLLAVCAYSQDTTKVSKRPKVGLVLSGGGAKGAAHIGVIKYLEEAGIPIDYIAGTSMGSIVGGFYALGYSSDEIVELISSVDWNHLISNNVERKRISFSEKLDRKRHLVTIPFSTGKGDEEFKKKSFRNALPGGIVSGDNLLNLFNSLSVDYSEYMMFSDLDIPFICIGTDLMTGEEKIFDRGEFATAIRASMAIPVLFDPVHIDGSLYVDGGLIKNFPAEECRAMGADYIIGVSMSPGLETDPSNLSSVFSQIKQLKEIFTDRNSDKYHERCDIFIRPELHGVGMLSFDAESVARVTQSGYDAIAVYEKEIKELKAKLDSAGFQSEAPKAKKKAKNIIKEEILISDIEFNGINPLLERWAERKCFVKEGETTTKEKIDNSVSIYYGTGTFESITYKIKKDPDEKDAYILSFYFIPSPPHDFGLGLRFDSQDMLSALIDIGYNNNRMNGFKVNLNAKLGVNQYLNLTTSYGHLLSPRINLSYNFRNSELDIYDSDYLIQNMKYLKHNFRLHLSENYSRWVSGGFGLEAEIIKNRKVMYSDFEAMKQDYLPTNTLGVFGTINLDNLDKKSFANRGALASADISWKPKMFYKGALKDLNIGSLRFKFEGYIPVIEDRFTIIPQAYVSALFGPGATNGYREAWNPIYKGPVPAYPHFNNIIGGTEAGRYIDQQLPFVGLNRLSLEFNYIAIARLDLRVRIFDNHYVTAMVNYARTGADLKNFFKEDNSNLLWPEMYDYNALNHLGAGIRYSIDTKIGPVSLDIASSNVSPRACFYFNVGYFF